MTKEEWYVHKMQDHIEAIIDYVDTIQQYSGGDTDLTGCELDKLRDYLYTIDHELDIRLEALK